MRSVRAVSLDLGWTLAYPRTSMWELFADLCTEAGVPTTPEDCEQLVRALWNGGQAHAENQFRAGALYPDSDAEFTGMFVNMGQVIFSQRGVENGHAELMQRFLQSFWNVAHWALFPEVTDILGALRARGLTVWVLSNAPSDLPAFLRELGLSAHLDFSVVSAIEGVRKPDRRIFEIALERAGVPAHEALHVGDMYLEDVLGGSAAGLHTLLIERGRNALFPSFRESHGRDLAPDAVVSDLHQVLDRLG